MSPVATDRYLMVGVDEQFRTYDLVLDEDIARTDTPDLMGLFDQLERTVSEIAGWDLAETRWVESDDELLQLVTSRMATAGDMIPAEEVLGDLDAPE